MKIDPASLLFSELSQSECAEMLAWAEELLRSGKTPVPEPDWVQKWAAAGGYDERQLALMLSTGLLPRVLMSLVRAMRPGPELEYCLTSCTFSPSVPRRHPRAPEGHGWRLVSTLAIPIHQGADTCVQWTWERLKPNTQDPG